MLEWTARVSTIAPTVIVGDEIGDDLLDKWLGRPGAVASTGLGRIEGTCTAFGPTIEAAAGYAVAAMHEDFGVLIDEIIAIEVATHEEADRRSDAMVR